MLQPLSRSRLVITVVRLAFAALIAVPAVASAQTITGQISGRVTDASGGVLPGVTVTVVNEGTGFKDVRVTDSGGVYTFTNLRVGTAHQADDVARQARLHDLVVGINGNREADILQRDLRQWLLFRCHPFQRLVRVA